MLILAYTMILSLNLRETRSMGLAQIGPKCRFGHRFKYSDKLAGEQGNNVIVKQNSGIPAKINCEDEISLT